MAKTYVDIDKDHAHIRKICRKLDADLKAVNKTAVNIPFGTGKTVVLEQIIYDNMDKNILVFVPTHLVRNKHLDSINQYCRKVYKNGRIVTPKNVTIRCYNSIKKCFDEPWDIIFADEYHHLGGEVWSKQFDALLRNNPKAKVIGTTATHVRADGKDMTEILFGHVSSEMTTSEAINSSILPHSKFYGAVYSLDGLYDEVSETIIDTGDEEDKINKKLLKKLKKHTEKANRLNEFFEEAIPENHGKYVVFCSCFEQMCTVWDKLDSWFAGKEISKYSVYYRNSRRINEKAIRDFENEDASNKFVFMLNINIISEGYHFKDLDGVIVYRPTKSIVKYPQQIGRPMTMDWKIYNNIPKIIELTNSIEDLRFFYTQAGIYRDKTLQNKKSSNRFFDELIDFSIFKDDREILDILNTLRFFETFINFDIGFDHAEQYYKEHGNLLVPSRYICKDGFRLGLWILNRRKDYKNGVLYKDRIERLETIGMVWNSIDRKFKIGLEHAEAYFRSYGNLLVSQDYICDDGFELGYWISYLRQKYKNGKLPEYKIKALESIGMVWDFLGYKFENEFSHAEQYFKKYGHLNVPLNYICDDGYKLGEKIQKRRTDYNIGNLKLSENNIKRYESIGMSWESVSDKQFRIGFDHAEKYFKEYGNLLVPQLYICPNDNYKLGNTIGMWRDSYDKGIISNDKIKMLESIGMVWNIYKYKSDITFEHAEKYFKEHGDLLVHLRYTCPDNFPLGRRINYLRSSYKKGRLSEFEIKRYESIKMSWNPKSDVFEYKFKHAESYFKEHGNLLVPRDYVCEDGFKLGRWILILRCSYSRNEVSANKIKMLESIGMVWNLGGRW